MVSRNLIGSFFAPCVRVVDEKKDKPCDFKVGHFEIRRGVGRLKVWRRGRFILFFAVSWTGKLLKQLYFIAKIKTSEWWCRGALLYDVSCGEFADQLFYTIYAVNEIQNWCQNCRLAFTTSKGNNAGKSSIYRQLEFSLQVLESW